MQTFVKQLKGSLRIYLMLLTSISLFIKWFFGCLFLQLGFTLLTLIWEFDFPPFMVLIIAILNDGKSLSHCLHNHPTTFAFCSQSSIPCKLPFCAFLNDYALIKVSGRISLLILIGHLYLSGVWVGVNPRTDIKKTSVYKKLDCMLKYC